MDNEKDFGASERIAEKAEAPDSNGSRARNRTVMLTPEITSQVRSRYAQEVDEFPPSQGNVRSGGGGAPDPSGFYAPSSRSFVAEEALPAPQQYTPAPRPSAAPQVRPAFHQGIVWVKESPIVGFLVAYDKNENGEVYDLRVGRVIVSNQSAGDENVLILQDETVSSMHAILRISASGEIQVLDQLSEYGTKIRRAGSAEEEVLSGDKSSVEHGDILSFGSRSFFVCMVPRA